MVIGDRQRHCNLTITLLAELAAVLPRHGNRVPPLLGKTRVVDDPRIDRPMALDCRQYLGAFAVARAKQFLAEQFPANQLLLGIN